MYGKMSKIFLYATHQSLVRYESSLFQKLGHETYSAIGTGNLKLDEETRNILSKINKSEHSKGETDPAIAKALKKFDVLYVSQIPGWLMAYGPAFLKAGKKVCFRVYGGNIAQWGWTKKPILALFKHPNFHMVSGWPGENVMWGKPLKSGFAYIDPKLLNPKSLEPEWKPFALTTMEDWHVFYPQLVKLRPRWQCKNRQFIVHLKRLY